MSSLAQHLPGSSLLRYRDLFAQLSQRKIDELTRGSWLGWGWSILQPLLQLAVYSVVFGLVMNGHFGHHTASGRFDYPLGIFMGLIVVNLINDTLMSAPGAVVNHANFVKKVVFPVELLPAAVVVSILHRAAFAAVLFVVALVVVGPGWTPALLWLPVILMPVVLMALGLGWALGALGVQFRDLGQITMFLTQVVFYASGVFYSADTLPPSIAPWLHLNPVLHAVELCRDVTLWHVPVGAGPLAYLWLCGIGTYVVGYLIFARLRPGLAHHL